MKLHVKIDNDGLRPYYDSDREMFDKLDTNLVYEITVRNDRNWRFHKKLMALIRLGHNNTNLSMPFEAYKDYVIMKAGYFEVYHTGKGSLIRPKSIAFDKMEQHEVEELYSKVIDVIIEDIKADKQFIEQNLVSFL